MASEQDALSVRVKQYLQSKYYDPAFPGSFSGADRFFNAIKRKGYMKLRKKMLKIG